MRSLLLTAIMILNTVTLQAKIGYADPEIFEVDSVTTIDIKLEGTIFIENGLNDQLALRTILKMGGKVIGFSNSDEIEHYSVNAEYEDNMLKISPVPREKLWAIGINTLSEEKTHYIHIPRNKNIIIKSQNAHIIVNGMFPVLKIENEKGKTEFYGSKDSIRYINCSSQKGEIVLNNNEINQDYNHISLGNSVIDINSKQGSIKLEIQ